MRCRPSGYYPRFQIPIETIRSSISSKAQKGRWLNNISRTRQAHWWRALRRHLIAFLTDLWHKGELDAFDYLHGLGQVPVSRCILIKPTEQCHLKAPSDFIGLKKAEKGELFMTEEEKLQVATFRFGIICEFVNGANLELGEKERLLREKSERKWLIPFSEKTRITRGTILR